MSGLTGIRALLGCFFSLGCGYCSPVVNWKVVTALELVNSGRHQSKPNNFTISHCWSNCYPQPWSSDLSTAGYKTQVKIG